MITNDFFKGMTAMAVSPNRRYIAVAEKGEKPSITVYEALHEQSKKRKVKCYRLH